jgi:hypothetical protein
MVRTFLILALGFVVAICGGIIGWMWGDWRVGLTVFLCATGISFVGASASILMIRTLMWLDVFFPFVISVPWTIILLPLKIPTQLFAAPAAIGSGLLLTLALWMHKSRGSSKAWIILPVIAWLYEMLPINIPGPFDDMFAFGGQITVLLLQAAKSQFIAAPDAPALQRERAEPLPGNRGEVIVLPTDSAVSKTQEG